MFDSSVSKLSERVLRNAPRLVSTVLIALITAELAQAALSLVHAPPTAPSLLGSAASRELERRREGIDIEEIAAAHLFGVLAVDPGMQEPIPTTAALVLAGTIATEDPNQGLAIIVGEDMRSKAYRVGQDVGGALLHAVYLDHVLLARNGKWETLALPRLPTAAKLSVNQSRPRLAAAAAAAVAKSFDSSDAPQVPDAPQVLGGALQVTPTLSGGTRGYRIVGGDDMRALQTAGLRPGDLMIAINGTSLQDQETAQRSFDELQSGHAVVTVMRRGRPADISVNLSE
jgi:general secretion pathway protein C